MTSAVYSGEERRSNIGTGLHSYIGIRLYLLFSMLFTLVHLMFDDMFQLHFMVGHLITGTSIVLSGFLVVILVGLYDTLTDGFQTLHGYRIKSLVENRHAIYMVLALFMCIVTSAILLTVSWLNIPILAKYFLDGLIATFIGIYDIVMKMKRHQISLTKK